MQWSLFPRMRKLQLKQILNVKGFLEKTQKSLYKHTGTYLLIAVLIYIVVLSTFTILKNQAFLTSGFDLGIFNQAFWTTTHDSRLFYETGDLSFNPGGSFFGVHFSPFLFLLVPFYSILPGPEILLVMQSAICAFGAFPVFWMSRDKLGRRAGFVLALVYLFYPALIFMNLNEFHLEAFTSTLFLFSVYYLEKEDWPKFFLFFVLSLSTIEFAPVIGVFVAVYGFILLAKRQLPRTKHTSIYLFVAALISIGFLILGITVKELLNPTTSAVPTPFHYLFSNPIDIFNVLSVQLDLKFMYLIYLFGPLAFLPFLAPEALVMALPWLSLSFLSSYNPYYSIFYFYSGFVIPFIFVALPKAISRFDSSKINGFYRSNKKRFLTLLILSMLVFSIYLPIVPDPTKSWNFTLPLNSPRNEDIRRILSLVPSNASILTQNDIFPHVSNRAEAYMYLPPNSPEISVDYILVDVLSQWNTWDQPDQFGERPPPSNFTQIILPEDILSAQIIRDGTYGILAWAENTILLKKGYTGEPVIFDPSLGFNYKILRSDNANGSVVQDANSTSGLVINSGDNSGVLWYGPYVNLNPGLYKVTYTVKVYDSSEINQNERYLTLDVTHSFGQVTDRKYDVNGSNVEPNGQWFDLTLIFGLEEPTQNMEFRGIGVEDHNVSLDYLVVNKISPIEFAFEPSALFADFGKASDGLVTYEIGSCILPKGNYTAKFWIQLNKPINSSLLDVGVGVSTDSKKSLEPSLTTSLTIYGSNFTKVNDWQTFDLDFTLSGDSNIVEFPGFNVRDDAPTSPLLVEVLANPGGQS
jgi:uncharacterized membrane protein